MLIAATNLPGQYINILKASPPKIPIGILNHADEISQCERQATVRRIDIAKFAVKTTKLEFTKNWRDLALYISFFLASKS
jgi:hypothetical protein